jgi:hypothetical protein
MTCRNRSSHLSVNGDALPGVSNRTRPVRLSLRRFKSRIQVRDELMQQIEILPDQRLNLPDVVSGQPSENALSGRDEIQERLVHLRRHGLVGHAERVAWRGMCSSEHITGT